MNTINKKLLAINLHAKFCRHNHTDGCGWYYEIDKETTTLLENKVDSTKSIITIIEIHNWEGSEHKEWLKKASEVIDLVRNCTE